MEKKKTTTNKWTKITFKNEIDLDLDKFLKSKKLIECDLEILTWRLYVIAYLAKYYQIDLNELIVYITTHSKITEDNKYTFILKQAKMICDKLDDVEDLYMIYGFQYESSTYKKYLNEQFDLNWKQDFDEAYKYIDKDVHYDSVILLKAIIANSDLETYQQDIELFLKGNAKTTNLVYLDLVENVLKARIIQHSLIQFMQAKLWKKDAEDFKKAMVANGICNDLRTKVSKISNKTKINPIIDKLLEKAKTNPAYLKISWEDAQKADKSINSPYLMGAIMQIVNSKSIAKLNDIELLDITERMDYPKKIEIFDTDIYFDTDIKKNEVLNFGRDNIFLICYWLQQFAKTYHISLEKFLEIINFDNKESKTQYSLKKAIEEIIFNFSSILGVVYAKSSKDTSFYDKVIKTTKNPNTNSEYAMKDFVKKFINKKDIEETFTIFKDIAPWNYIKIQTSINDFFHKGKVDGVLGDLFKNAIKQNHAIYNTVVTMYNDIYDRSWYTFEQKFCHTARLNELIYTNIESIFYDHKIKNIKIEPSKSVDAYQKELFVDYNQVDPQANKLEYGIYKILNEEDTYNRDGILKINFKKELMLVQLMAKKFLYNHIEELCKVNPFTKKHLYNKVVH